MNATLSADSIESSVADQYPKKSKSLDDILSVQGARRSLALTSFVKPFFVSGGNLFAAIWRAIVNTVRRVARTFGVNVNVPENPPQRLGGSDSPAAEFVASDDSPASRLAVDEAAKESSRDLAQLAHQIARSKPTAEHEEILKGEGGLAFAALQLQALGSAVLDSSSELAALQKTLDEECAVVAAACGATPESVVALLDQGNLSDPVLSASIPQSVVDMYGKVSAAKGTRAAFELQFCSYAIAAIRCAQQSARPEMEAMCMEKSRQFADQKMSELIMREAYSPKEGAESENSANSSSSQLQFQTGIESQDASIVAPVAKADTAFATGLPKPSRSRAGMSAGQEASESDLQGYEEDERGDRNSLRQR